MAAGRGEHVGARVRAQGRGHDHERALTTFPARARPRAGVSPHGHDNGRRRLTLACPYGVAVVFALLLSAGPVGAQADRGETPGDAATRVTYRLNVNWLNAVRLSLPSEGELNPDNARLSIPQLFGQTELRGNLRVEFGSRAQLIVRPRVRAFASRARSEGLADRDERDVEADWTELYFSWMPVNAVSVTYGLQNFQWGPAELLAPSNRVFHETGLFRDPIYYVPGRHLLRVNLSAGKQWSVVLLSELGATAQEPFRAGETFARQALAKVEYTTESGGSYVGATAGGTQGEGPWFGGYGMLGLTEGLSVYADASTRRGSEAWYPVLAGVVPTFARSQEAGWRGLAVLGARYTFARGDDLRVEWLLDDAGWTREQFRLGLAAASIAPSREAFAPYLAPGLEFVGRQLVLLSLRTPDLPPSKHVQIQTRFLQSFTDTSRVLFATGSYDASDALVLFASGTVTGGPPEGEFSRLVRASLVVGATYTW